MSAIDLTLLVLALAGHLTLWVAIANRLLALGLSRYLHRAVMVAMPVAVFVLPIAYWLSIDQEIAPGGMRHLELRPTSIFGVYLMLCWVALIVQLVVALYRLGFNRAPATLRANHSRRVKIMVDDGRSAPARGHLNRLLAGLPGNQVAQIEISDKQIEIARLPEALDGLSIVHLSDFHAGGALEQSFFAEAVQLACSLEPDMIALTGDFIDRADQVDSLAAVLGDLDAPLGVYYVLGNHDLCVDPKHLRRALDDVGLIDLAGISREISFRGHEMYLAGNEMPWIAPAPNIAPLEREHDAEAPLRILLAHTPDVLPWARARAFDLMLAGHTHGGQIRLPLLGAWVCPSRFGVRYACGVFQEPPTVMHVSRGLSSLHALRFACPPELTRLVLRAPVESGETEDSRSKTAVVSGRG